LPVPPGGARDSHCRLPERDHETGIFHAAYEWTLTGKFTLFATARRDIAAPAGGAAAQSVSDRIKSATSW
jgi:hypothetical protein